MAGVNDLQDGEFESRVLQAQEPILLEFWAAWCGPCRRFAPIIGEVLEEFKDRLRLLRVNTDEVTKIPETCGVTSIPTLILYDQGQEIARFVGKKTAVELRAGLSQVLPSNYKSS